jgi:hypothetical protein
MQETTITLNQLQENEITQLLTQNAPHRIKVQGQYPYIITIENNNITITRDRPPTQNNSKNHSQLRRPLTTITNIPLTDPNPTQQIITAINNDIINQQKTTATQ